MKKIQDLENEINIIKNEVDSIKKAISNNEGLFIKKYIELNRTLNKLKYDTKNNSNNSNNNINNNNINCNNNSNIDKDIKFTEVEQIILQNVDKKYNWIVRDEDDIVWLFTEKPEYSYVGGWFTYDGDVRNINEFNHLFKCIKSTDTEPCEFKKYIH